MLEVLSVKGRPVEPPPIAGSAARLLTCSRNEVLCRLTLGAVLNEDALLASRFLHFTRSSLVTGKTRTESLAEVLESLDAGILSHVAVMSAIVHTMPARSTKLAFDCFRFWQHSLATGVFARVLLKSAAIDSKTDPTEAFTAGLLHDLGRVILHVYFPREFSAVLQYQKRHDTWIRDAEIAVLGYDHCLIGEHAAIAWGLPIGVSRAIGAHHQPDNVLSDPAANLIGLVHVADILARGLQLGYPGDDTIPLLSETTLRRLGLNWQSLRHSLEEVAPLMDDALVLLREGMQA